MIPEVGQQVTVDTEAQGKRPAVVLSEPREPIRRKGTRSATVLVRYDDNGWTGHVATWRLDPIKG